MTRNSILLSVGGMSLLLFPLTGVQADQWTVDQQLVQARIVERAKQEGVDPALALAIAEKESRFKPRARLVEKKLKTASMGVFQILATTARRQFKFKGPLSGLYDVETNIGMGIAYLKQCYVDQGKTLDKIACCYQAGFKAKEKFCSRDERVQRYELDLREKFRKWKAGYEWSGIRKSNPRSQAARQASVPFEVGVGDFAMVQ